MKCLYGHGYVLAVQGLLCEWSHFELENNDDVLYRQAREDVEQLPYVFDTHDDWLPTSSRDLALTSAMKTSWIAFAKTGRPQEAGLWPAWSSEKYAAFFEYPVSYGVLDTTLCGLLGSD